MGMGKSTHGSHALIFSIFYLPPPLHLSLLVCRGFVLAGLADMQKPPEFISPNMTGSE
jgi:hypothetical protein